MQIVTREDAVTRELDQVASATGLDRRSLRVREIDWSQYLQAGVLVKLSVHQCISMSADTLEDLGVRPQSQEEQEAIARTLSGGGYSTLLPKRMISQADKIKGEGRRALENVSYDLYWGRISNSRFVPQQVYRGWAEANAEIRSRYLRLADVIFDQWDALVRENEVDLLVRGRENYRRLRGVGVEIPEPIDVYASNFVTRKMKRLQPRDVARKKFTWDHSVEFLPIRTAVEESIKSLVTSDDPMLRDLAMSEERRVAGGVVQLGQELVGAIRGRVYNVVLDCLTSMQANKGELQRNSTSQIRRMYEAIQKLQFWPDAELEQKLQSLRALIDQDSDYRDDGEVAAALERLGIECRTYLLEIDRPPERSGAALGIPDEPILVARPIERAPLDQPDPGALLGASDLIPVPTGR